MIVWIVALVGASAIFSVAAILALRWLVRRSRPLPHDWHDRYAPKCAKCGFDLRESIDHCPECGTAVGAFDRTVIWHLMRLRKFESAGDRVFREAVEAATARRGRLL